MGVSFENVSSQEGLKKLDQYLSTRSYISGYQASRDDLAVYGALANVPAEYTNASRWFKHITALAGPQLSAPGVGVQIESGAAPATAAAVASPVEEVSAPTAEGDDDDLDLFGDETEEGLPPMLRVRRLQRRLRVRSPKLLESHLLLWT